MSGRERTFFSFDVDEWINALLERFKSQVQNHAAKLASQIEHFTTAKLATELELLDPKQKADFVKNLRSDIDAVRSKKA